MSGAPRSRQPRLARFFPVTLAYLLALTTSAWAVPTTSFVHTLSESEFTFPAPGEREAPYWQSSFFEFGETVELNPGDSMVLTVQFAGTQRLSFTDSGNERVGVDPLNVVFNGDVIAGGPWTFTGIEGNLSRHPLGFRISNVPVLIADSSFVEPGETVTVRGVDLILQVAPRGGGMSFDGFSLVVGAGDFEILGSASAVPEPGTFLLLGLALAGGLALRRRHTRGL